MLSQNTIDIIKSTVPALREHGVEITTAFYKRMFANHPEIKSMFNMDKQKSGEQPKALAMAVLAAAQNIDNLQSLHITSLSAFTSVNNEVIPNTHNKLNILDPTILDIAISALLFIAAVILTAASGADVPKATKVKPIIIDGILKYLAILDAPPTNISAPLINKTNPRISNKYSINTLLFSQKKTLIHLVYKSLVI